MARRTIASGELPGLLLIWAPLAVIAAGLLLQWDRVLLMAVAIGGAAAATYTLGMGPWRRRARVLQDLSQSTADFRARLGMPAESTGGEPEQSLRLLDQAHAAAAQRLSATGRDFANLRAVFDAAASPVVATNAAGELLYCNRAAETFFDRPGGLVGRSIEDLFTQAEVLGQHAAALAGKERQGQFRMMRADGPRVYQVLTAPVPLTAPAGANRNDVAAPETGVVVTLRDVTELATAVQLKTDFVANASHELRTPLSSIKAAVDTLADGAWDDPAMRERLTQMIGANASRLEEMVRDLLDLSRLESPEAAVQLEEIRLSDIAQSLREIFEAVARERSLTLAFDIGPGAERLVTDSRLLTLILKNLIDNSTKFAYERSTVRVIARARSGDSARADGRLDLLLRVADKGVGIPFGHQQRIFERFFQVDPARAGTSHRRGTGLGLAIVKHAVKALGGTIGVESVWKEGTTMTVELPGVVENAT